MSSLPREDIFVAGLGMVGIGERLVAWDRINSHTATQAFIEKILNLDERQNYRLVVCGEEFHFAYNRVSPSPTTAEPALPTHNSLRSH